MTNDEALMTGRSDDVTKLRDLFDIRHLGIR